MNPYCQTNLKLAVGFPLCSCVHRSTRHESAQHGKIFLYEELPSNERILEKELKIWMQNQEDDDTISKFPMKIDLHQILVVMSRRKDETMMREYYRTDGNEYLGSPSQRGLTQKEIRRYL